MRIKKSAPLPMLLPIPTRYALIQSSSKFVIQAHIVHTSGVQISGDKKQIKVIFHLPWRGRGSWRSRKERSVMRSTMNACCADDRKRNLRAYIEQPATSDNSRPLKCHNGQLHHLRYETVASQFFSNTAHDKLMTKCT